MSKAVPPLARHVAAAISAAQRVGIQQKRLHPIRSPSAPPSHAASCIATGRGSASIQAMQLPVGNSSSSGASNQNHHVNCWSNRDGLNQIKENDGNFSKLKYEKPCPQKVRLKLARHLIDYSNWLVSQKHKPCTVSALADENGEILKSGYSGTWKTDNNIQENKVARLVDGADAEFDPSANRFGTACAEAHCFYQLERTNGRNRNAAREAAYSLAYDGVASKFKSACSNCQHILFDYRVTDLYWTR